MAGKVPSLVASAIDFIIFLTGIYLSHSRSEACATQTLVTRSTLGRMVWGIRWEETPISWVHGSLVQMRFWSVTGGADSLTKILTPLVLYACQSLGLSVTYSQI
jgi:hypothetical protein